MTRSVPRRASARVLSGFVANVSVQLEDRGIAQLVEDEFDVAGDALLADAVYAVLLARHRYGCAPDRYDGPDLALVETAADVAAISAHDPTGDDQLAYRADVYARAQEVLDASDVPLDGDGPLVEPVFHEPAESPGKNRPVGSDSGLGGVVDD